ncbi:hypothetical protein BKA65DRAFT_564852 [Rhexocercosporidium sp. MPI-PUGE-AT-0058]|nr:hypothetical protein BKA65DRAFT_564852 [Rhexocercosporidium sp. MPI-PUGE-AT-0058]
MNDRVPYPIRFYPSITNYSSSHGDHKLSKGKMRSQEHGDKTSNCESTGTLLNLLGRIGDLKRRSSGGSWLVGDAGADGDGVGSWVVASIPGLITSQTDHSAPKTTIASVNASSEPIKSSTTPAVVFTLFPKLPLELRRMIWRKVLLIPQVISIGYSPQELLHSRYPSEEAMRPSGSRCFLSAVSQEARRQALDVQERLSWKCSLEQAICRNVEGDILWVDVGY